MRKKKTKDESKTSVTFSYSGKFKYQFTFELGEDNKPTSASLTVDGKPKDISFAIKNLGEAKVKNLMNKAIERQNK